MSKWKKRFLQEKGNKPCRELIKETQIKKQQYLADRNISKILREKKMKEDQAKARSSIQDLLEK